MPDESCRACGGILADFSQCAECKKIISLICKSCQRKTIEQFHSQCIGLTDLENRNTSLIEDFQNFAIA